MADESIDKLKIEIEASAKDADDVISSLIKDTSKLQKALGKIDFDKFKKLKDSIDGISESAGKLADLGNAITNFTESMKNLPSGKSFERLASGIEKLGSANTDGVRDTAAALKEIAESAKSLNDSGISDIRINTGGTSSQKPSTDNDTDDDWVSVSDDAKSGMDSLSDSMKDVVTAAQNASGPLGAFATFASAVAVGGRIAGSALKTILASAMNGVASAAKNMAPKIATATLNLTKMTARVIASRSMLGKLTSVVSGVSSAMQGLAGKLSSVVRLFTFMLLRKAITALFKELGTAIQHLAQRSDSFNAQLSSLMSACSQFSHQVAALAAPLLNIFGPALQTIINMLSTATAYINQFLSALTGKSVFTSAKAVATDYAASLSDAAGAAKELENATVGIDELNIISADDGSSGGSGGGSGALEDCYEELAINQKILDLVQQIKDLAATLFEPVKASWDDYGQGVMDAFRYAIDACSQAAKDMGATFVDVWTNGTGYETCSNILLLLESMLNWVGDIATAWDQAWQVKGEGYVQSLFDELNAILSLVHTISESFRAAFDSGSGEEAFEHILQSLTNIHETIANICNGFAEAWAEAAVGNDIAQLLFDILNSVLGTVEEITGSVALWAENLNFSPLLESIRSLLESIAPLVTNIGSVLSWLYSDVILPLGTWAIETVLPAVIEAVAAGFDAVNSVFVALQPVFEWIWEHMLQPLASWTGGTIIEIIEGITSVFRGLDEVFKMIADGQDWGEIGTYIWEGLLNGITSAASWVWEKFKEIFGGIVDLVKDVFGIHSPSTVFEEIGDNLVSGLLNGISGAWGTIVDFLTPSLDDLKDLFTGAWDKIKETTSGAWDTIKNTFSGAWENVKSGTSTAWSAITGFFSNSFGTVKSDTSSSWSEIENSFSGSLKTVSSNTTSSWSTIKSTFSSAWSTIKTQTTSSWSSIRSTFSSSWSAVRTEVTTSWQAIQKAFTEAWTEIMKEAEDSWTSIKEEFTESWEAINTEALESLEELLKAFTDSMTEILNTITDGWSDIKTTFTDGVSEIKSIITDEDWEGIGEYIVEGLWEGIDGKWDWLEDKVWDYVEDLIDEVEDELEIDSPSKRFAEIGYYIVAGLNEGIEDNRDSSVDSVNDWVSKISNIQADVGVNFNVAESFKNYKPNLDTGFTSDTILRTVQETVNTNGMVSATLESGGGIKEAIIEAIDEKITSVLASIEESSKRQADKSETTKVYVGSREIAKAVKKQQIADGYSFSTAT